MKLNEAVITHHRAKTIPIEKLKKKISINEAYLREKPTWYVINGDLQYFKIRSDFRLFTEQFFSMFGREIMGLDTLDYEVAYVRTISETGEKHSEETKCGLLSKSFQSNLYNYYLVSELMSAELSDFIAYGGYTMERLLAFFKDYLNECCYNKNELFLIKLFISDAFTHQEDRNYHNISFKIPKIKGVAYNERLHPRRLVNRSECKEHIEINEDGIATLKNLSPAKVYDNERILGVDHKDVKTYHPGQIWSPLFPYNDETKFASTAEAAKVSTASFDGLDPNLVSLYYDYESICKPYFERLAYDDEYRRILERFQGKTAQVNLSEASMEYVKSVLEDKREVFRKILTY